MVEGRREQERREREQRAAEVFAVVEGYRAKRYDSRRWMKNLTGNGVPVNEMDPTLQEVYAESCERVRLAAEKTEGR